MRIRFEVAIGQNRGHPQPAHVIGGVHSVSSDVEVVIDRCVVRFIKPQNHRIVQIADVCDVRPRAVAKSLLVQFIVEVNHGLVFVQPTLVSVCRLRVIERGDELHVHFVSHIDNGHAGTPVEAKCDFMAGVIGIRTLIHDDLSVVGVGTLIRACSHGAGRVRHVHRVQPSTGGVGPHPEGMT